MEPPVKAAEGTRKGPALTGGGADYTGVIDNTKAAGIARYWRRGGMEARPVKAW